MFGYYGGKVEVTNCPNCGAKGWDDKKKDYECEKCGYHKVESKELPPIDLIFCEGCGCTRSEACTLHPPEKQKKVT
jgi:hypothetical protein